MWLSACVNGYDGENTGPVLTNVYQHAADACCCAVLLPWHHVSTDKKTRKLNSEPAALKCISESNALEAHLLYCNSIFTRSYAAQGDEPTC